MPLDYDVFGGFGDYSYPDEDEQTMREHYEAAMRIVGRSPVGQDAPATGGHTQGAAHEGGAATPVPDRAAARADETVESPVEEVGADARSAGGPSEDPAPAELAVPVTGAHATAGQFEEQEWERCLASLGEDETVAMIGVAGTFEEQDLIARAVNSAAADIALSVAEFAGREEGFVLDCDLSEVADQLRRDLVQCMRDMVSHESVMRFGHIDRDALRVMTPDEVIAATRAVYERQAHAHGDDRARRIELQEARRASHERNAGR